MPDPIRDDLWFCDDCTIFHANGDMPPDASPEREAEIEAGFASMGGHVAADNDPESGEGIREFTWRACDCCGSKLGGGRHRHAVFAITPSPPAWPAMPSNCLDGDPRD